MKVCTLFGCNNKYLAGGLCQLHYHRLRNTGVLYPKRKRTFLEACEEYAVWKGECLVWVGYRNDSGYGIHTVWTQGKNKLRRVHRMAWLLSGRYLPEGYVLDHTCHNRACLNVRHLRTVTRAENAQNRRGANKNSSTGIRGVSWSEERAKWVVQVMLDRKHVGSKRFTCFGKAMYASRDTRKVVFTHSEDNK